MTDVLAIRGGAQAVKGQIRRYNSISEAEADVAAKCITAVPLSGFLGGNQRGGPMVQRLEELWANKFGVEHAIACNSATSGLLAACAAAGVGPGSEVLTTPFTMSATAAAPKLLGASIKFQDVDPETFCLAPDLPSPEDAIIVTNLFGHPAKLKEWRWLADRSKSILIEDNAQGPLAMEDGKYAGTIGHIGVFSLNVHKHLQCGEGGVVVTRDADLAHAVRNFINHGEMAGDRVGLNLRMTEYTAAIACSQLGKIDELVGVRAEQAKKIRVALDGVAPWLKMTKVRRGCRHVYYMLPFLLELPEGVSREAVLTALKAEGFPVEGGYVKPLYHLPAFAQTGICSVAEELHTKTLMTFSNCEWSPTNDQIQQFAEAVYKVDKLLVRSGEKVSA
tara:strand:- start:933 stop:2105 length:1173 start_codon:yes stop_codon:yes gene_type:complete